MRILKIIVPGFGAGKYHVAAADSRRRLTQLLDSTGWSIDQIDYVLETGTSKSQAFFDSNVLDKKGDWFLHKFKVWKQALLDSNDDMFLHMDADASVTSSFSLKSLITALGDKSIGMVEQKKVLGSCPLGKKELFEHYQLVSHEAVNPGSKKLNFDNFKYFNTGFVLFRRKALEEFLIWAKGIMVDMPRDIEGHMVADQDIIQVYANEIIPEEIAELDWRWNHCQWWDEDFPNSDAQVIHMSNFCQGPAASQMNRLAVLSRGEFTKSFSDLTLLMVTHNSDKVLDDSLATLLEIPGLDILIIDNKSSQAPMPTTNSRIRVIINDANLGYAAAINIGLAEVKTEYVGLLNPDALLTYEATLEAIEKLQKNPNQLLAPNFFDSKGNFTASLRCGYSMSRLIQDLIPNQRHFSRKIAERFYSSREGEDFPWLIGACIFSSTRFLRNIGGLDARYFLYMEDVELGIRASKKGDVRSLESSIEHLGAQSTNKSQVFIEKELAKARLEYLRRHFGFWAWVLTKVLYKSTQYFKFRVDK